MYKFLYKVNADGSKVPAMKKPMVLLPDPNQCTTPEQQRIFVAANDAIDKCSAKIVPRKHHNFSDEMRTSIAKKCIEIGPTKTVNYFQARDVSLHESTVRYIRNLYIKQQKIQKSDDPKFIKKKPWTKVAYR